MAGLSELEAVNMMLTNIGETPVSTLEGASGDAYVSIAQSVLNEINRAVQEKGWHFNTDKNYTITPDVDNYVSVASNVITLDTIKGGVDVAIRQGKLYNKDKHTFLFEDGAFKCDVIWEFDFMDTPQYLRQFIAIRAARVFSNRMQGDITGAQLSADDELQAKITAKRHDNRQADRTMFQNYSNIGRLQSRRI